MTDKERYRNDPEYREKRKAAARERYWEKKKLALDSMLAARRIKVINNN